MKTILHIQAGKVAEHLIIKKDVNSGRECAEKNVESYKEISCYYAL